MDGLEFVFNNYTLNQNIIFKIPPKAGSLVYLKKTKGDYDSKCYESSKVMYNDKNLTKKAIKEGEQEEVKVQGKVYPEMVSYNGFFGGQFVVVYQNNHESLTLRVLIKFRRLSNLSMVSEVDKRNGYWKFSVKPGRQVIKKLYPTNPFEEKGLEGMSTKLFIIDPTNNQNNCKTGPSTPKQANQRQLPPVISPKVNQTLQKKHTRRLNLTIDNSLGDINGSDFSTMMRVPTSRFDDAITPHNCSVQFNNQDTKLQNIQASIKKQIFKLMRETNHARY